MGDKLFKIQNKEEKDLVKDLLPIAKLSLPNKKNIHLKAYNLVKNIRKDRNFSIEEFLNIYNISHAEGIAILGLAEGLLRAPDFQINKELISDKLSNKEWSKFLFKGNKSFKTIFSSFGLYFAGKYTDIVKYKNIAITLFDKLGQPIFIKILRAAILYLSKEFVFSDNMNVALSKTEKYSNYKFAFDLLGESARTQKQADIYYEQYEQAIELIAKYYPDNQQDIMERPNLSVKLTSLHPRFEYSKLEQLKIELMPKLIKLVKKTMDANISITFDAEECYRTDLYFIFLTELIKQKVFKDFAGIGFVVQAYQTRAIYMVQYIAALAKELGRIIPVRLVKGAYWDSEIKHAQELGLKHYPVFTKKNYTDLSYIACVKKLFENDKYIYPQFATHNALTAAQVIEIARDKNYEFQKLYGMGDALHKQLSYDATTRIYAPVGTTKDLLAYLMRRILENGASANFVSKVSDMNLPISDIIHDTNDKVLSLLSGSTHIALPEDLYPKRKNAMGYEIGYKDNYDYLYEKISSYYNKIYSVGSIIGGKEQIIEKNTKEYFCPAKNAEKLSEISNSVEGEIKDAIAKAEKSFAKWAEKNVRDRAKILEKIAKEFEKNKFEIYALLIKEAGKSISDAVNEVIEAIDFCRYYANLAPNIMQEKKLPSPTGEHNILSMHGRGVFLCISPWNFPFAIFTGQIVAALVSGNSVIAKPAEQTSVIANYTIKLMHKAGIPKNILHLIFCSGLNTSKYIVSDERIGGVAFTGSCETAKKININLAERNSGIVPLIAETGGQNAMIVDSSALLEQVTDDALISAFYSAGQRCSALRVLYVQEEIYDELIAMIKGAMDLLRVGDTTDFSTDIGPVIDAEAKKMLEKHITNMQEKGYNIYKHPQNEADKSGHYFYPHIIEINSINDIENEKFGPILHIAKYKSSDLDKIIDEVNNYGFGLTFGVHSRIEEKIQYIKSRIQVGNIYANRSIVGAKVESQPFGGENKSGTGFKAGGPNYLLRFMTERTTSINIAAFGGDVELLNSSED